MRNRVMDRPCDHHHSPVTGTMIPRTGMTMPRTGMTMPRTGTMTRTAVVQDRHQKIVSVLDHSMT